MKTQQKTNKYEIDMCNGSILDKLISFSIPLMLSGILQLLFNAVDIIVVGRFTGSEALAAVGSTTALINVFVNFFIGISLGSNVLAARFFAAGKDKEMSETVHTAITLALISGVGMGIIGVLAAKGALMLMDTPDNVLNLSTLYMRIYFVGMPFFMLYNYGAAILRAVGDTKRPLLFLIISGSVNVVLNLIFRDPFSYGRCGSSDRNRDLSGNIMCSGTALSVPHREQLSAAVFQAWHEGEICKADFSGRRAGGHSEYDHQFLECTAAVLGQFVWLCGDGRLYRSQ